MNDPVRRLAIIPARGGSKRIPRKNVRPFCGRPMIAHILDTAQASGLFDVIHVSTEDQEIADIVLQLGYPVRFMRPAHLADDFTGTMPVLNHVVETFRKQGEVFTQVFSLLACAPLIEPDDLVGGARLFESLAGRHPVLAVAPYPAPVEWAFDRQTNGMLVPRTPGAFAMRSQDLQTAYYDAGTFAIFSSSFITDHQEGTDVGFVGYPLSRDRAVDIDTIEDWEFTERLYLARTGR